jgi:hypothetical protein
MSDQTYYKWRVASPGAARQAMKTAVLPFFRLAILLAALGVATVIAGLVYSMAIRHRFQAVAVWGRLSRLSTEQAIALAAGFAVAPTMIAFAYYSVSRGISKPQNRWAAGLLRALTLLLVLALYAWGARHAYRVSLALSSSTDWALIHGVYSWGYIGFAFVNWSAGHAAEPFTRSLGQFWRILAR